MNITTKTVVTVALAGMVTAFAGPALAHGQSTGGGFGASRGDPYYGSSCRSAMSDRYCDYNSYNGSIYVGGRWTDAGTYRHRVSGGRHQFWYNGSWQNGGWQRDGHGQWGGSGGWHH